MTSRTIAITGATALCDAELAPIEDACLLIRDGRIAALAGRESVDVPDDAELLDAAGSTLLPGFIDAHVHIGFYDPHEVVRGGVTAVRDLGWPPQRIFGLAQRSRSEGFMGPLVLAAGPILTAVGGYPSRAAWAPRGTARQLRSARQAVDAVADVSARGAAIVKVALDPRVGPTLDASVLRALVDAAHEHHLRVTAHLHGLHELDKAVTAGVDELAHMITGDRIPGDVLTAMVERAMVVVPTLSIRFGRHRTVAIDNVAAFLATGGTVVYGTDLGNTGPQPGIDRREVRAMLSAGMTERDVIASATVVAATRLGITAKGSLASGMDADVVAVPGDPLPDTTSLASVSMVFREGRRLR